MSKKPKLLITGASSMIGRAVIKYAQDYEIIAPTHKEFDMAYLCDVEDIIDIKRPDYCIHLAGYNGNLQFNQKYPADIFFQTSIMALNVLYACQQNKVKKVVSLLSSCAYPDKEGILYEKDLLNGSPNPTVEAHGFAKRVIFEYSRQLQRQCNFTSVCMICNTGYGPYDSYDIEKTKVVGGLIKKFVEAKKQNLPEVICWGSGTVKRELIYCDDIGYYLIKTLEDYNDTQEPLNIGSGVDITIRELANTIKTIIGYEGQIVWDMSKPDGQKQKLLSNEKATKLFGVLELTTLEEGLRTTVEWYNKNYE